MNEKHIFFSRLTYSFILVFDYTNEFLFWLEFRHRPLVNHFIDKYRENIENLKYRIQHIIYVREEMRRPGRVQSPPFFLVENNKDLMFIVEIPFIIKSY